jgi:hypothetical protein
MTQGRRVDRFGAVGGKKRASGESSCLHGAFDRSFARGKPCAMLIPYYWAEARFQNKAHGKQITVRRWGWSDTSQADAQALADQRAQDAWHRIHSGESLRRRETKDSYGTQEGVPIREEVVSRHGENVITRNSYGSLCLNAPRVLFADIDAQWPDALRIRPLGCLFLVLTGLLLGLWQRSLLIGAGIAIGLPWLWSAINGWINHARRPKGEKIAKQQRLEAIRAFSAAHPHWHLRVYETPAGYRLLAMHDVFDPTDGPAREALAALNSDRRFATLCALQQCFRARVSPKYWRIGYKPKEPLPKSKWPFLLEHLSRRQRWIEGYDRLAPNYAACLFIERLGSSTTHPEAEQVRAVHDQFCQAESGLPLA